MSLTNPNKPVTEARLQEFYQQIKPYLGLREMPSGDMDEIVSPKPSVSHGNANPTGTIISFMGNYAPDGYLACDGSTKNIADYPRLANFFQVQFGSINKFGGDGTTTFAVPDLRGQFLRGTGTNSDTTQGNGAAVGTRQAGTLLATYSSAISSSKVKIKALANTNGEQWATDFDKRYSGTGTSGGQVDLSGTWSGGTSEIYKGTTRPTNTSILYCIKD